MDNSENHFDGHFDKNTTAIVPNLCEKLRNFAVQFRTNTTVKIIKNLLQIFRSENHCDLPKSAVGSLQTKSNGNIIIMKSSKNTNGSYVYFGIEEGLKGIMTDDYTENSMRIRVVLIFELSNLKKVI